MIVVKDLWFKYPYREEYALKGINLEIKEGEFVAIMGDNGAGKTTLIKHLNGLLKPSRGDVYIDNISTKEASIAELSRKVALVFQYPEKMFFNESVAKEIEFGLKNFGFPEIVRRRQINKVLSLLWLDGLEDRSPFMLSGGEQRRLALATVLAWDPKYVVLDEPTAGQDRFNREVLMGIIKMLINQQKTVIIVTHDVEFVAELKPRVIIMCRGKIIADGSAEKILTDAELLDKAGLYPPAIAKLTLELKNLGYINKVMVNLEDILSYLSIAIKGVK